MSRMMWDVSNMIARGFRSGIHSGHGQVSMISTGKEWLKSGKKKHQPDNKKKIADSMSTFKNLMVEEQTPALETEENVQEIQPSMPDVFYITAFSHIQALQPFRHLCPVHGSMTHDAVK